MSFNARLNFEHTNPPMRAYVHKTWGHYQEAEEYLNDVLHKYEKEFAKCGFILAAVWRSETSNNLDVLRFDFSVPSVGIWPGNPVISPWSVKNGLYDPRETTLEDIVIVFGEEGKYRRTTKTLEEYVKKWPYLEKLEPQITEPISHSETSNL
jgi:hypothetical protein